MQEKRIFLLPIARCPLLIYPRYTLDKTSMRIHPSKPNKRQPEGQRLENLELRK